MKAFFDTETLGLEPQARDTPTLAEELAIKHFYDNVRFEQGRYYVSLPFDPEAPKPQCNYKVALRQFLRLERSLIADKRKARTLP